MTMGPISSAVTDCQEGSPGISGYLSERSNSLLFFTMLKYYLLLLVVNICNKTHWILEELTPRRGWCWYQYRVRHCPSLSIVISTLAGILDCRNRLWTWRHCAKIELDATYLSLVRIFHTGQKEGDGLFLGRIKGSHSGRMMKLSWTLSDVTKDLMVEVEYLGCERSDGTKGL